MMGGLWWVQAVLTVIEVIGVFWLVRVVFEEKGTGAGEWLSGLGVLALAGITVYQRTIAMYSRWWLVATILVGGFLLKVSGRKKKWQAWTLLALYFETLYCLDIFIYIAVKSIQEGNAPLIDQHHIGIERIIIFLISRSVMGVCCVFLCKYRRRVAYYWEIGRKLWVVIILLEHLSLICCDCIFVQGAEQEAMGGWRMLLLFYPVLMAFVAFYFIQQRYHSLYEQVERQNALYSERYEMMAEKSREKERVYHDFKNHMILLQKMVKDGDGFGAYAYLQELLQAGTERDASPETGVSLLDYLIQVKISEASRKLVRVEKEYEGRILELDRQGLMDFCVLIGNLWDNAIEGCERVGEDRRIRFVFLCVGNGVTIKMENSCHPDVKTGRLVTTKADRGMHGIGLRNIDFIVNKYGGRVKRECRNGMFITQVTLIFP